MRTFASKSDKDLLVGISIASIAITIILTVVGVTGLLAAWSGVWPGDPPQDGSYAFFLLLAELPNWVVGVVLVMVIALSTAAFDSLQSATVSTASNDLFRNKLGLWWIRLGFVLIMIPMVVLAIKAPNILQIYLISDLISSAAIPVLFIGLWSPFHFWSGWEVVIGSLGGLLSVFIFGTIYYHDALMGAQLMLLEEGLYGDDWSAFGAFVAAPVGGLIFALITFAIRVTVLYVLSRVRKERFTLFDKPVKRSNAGSFNDETVAAIEADRAEVQGEHTKAGDIKA
jgi:hypothetical protein